MSGKSPSGFADLRAKFENQSDVTPPPSRGRSPAGTESLSGGRKIRTSFISVERSGRMAPTLDQEDSTGSSNAVQKNTAIGEKEVKTEHQDGPKDLAGTNKDNESAIKSINEPSNGTLEPGKATATDATNLDKPTTAAEDDVPTMQPADSKDESAVSGGFALAPKGENLGTLLKGSEFEPEQKGSQAKTLTAKKNPKTIAGASDSSTPTRSTKGPEKSAPSQLKARDSPKVNGSPKSKPESALPTNTSEPTGTKPASTEPGFQEPTASESVDVPTSATEEEGPKTPFSSTATKEVQSEQPLQKTASSKQSLQPSNGAQAADKDHKKTIPEKAGRPSLSMRLSQPTTASNGKIASTAASRVPKKSTAGSPTTAKPKPRSPTRPVRLPSSATAPTAASAARTGADIQNNTSDKLMTGTKGLPKTPQVNALPPRTRAPRSSLPAPTAVPKPKQKPRTSAGGDFLARMMRPTQSSASKAHDKVAEQPTPAKKRVSSRPKTLGDESNKEAGNKSVADEHTEDNIEDNGQEVKNDSDHVGAETDQGATVPETIEENSAADTQHADEGPLTHGAAEPVPAQ